jgi:hypothetical protein
MLGNSLRFFVFWFVGATLLGLFLGRMIRGRADTPALVIPPDAVPASAAALSATQSHP